MLGLSRRHGIHRVIQSVLEPHYIGTVSAVVESCQREAWTFECRDKQILNKFE